MIRIPEEYKEGGSCTIWELSYITHVFSDENGTWVVYQMMTVPPPKAYNQKKNKKKKTYCLSFSTTANKVHHAAFTTQLIFPVYDAVPTH